MSLSTMPSRTPPGPPSASPALRAPRTASHASSAAECAFVIFLAAACRKRMTLFPPRASLCPQILSSVAASTAITCAGVPSRGTPSCASTVLVAICHHARLYDATRSAARGENQRESVFEALSRWRSCFLETRYLLLHTAHVERRAPPSLTETCCQRLRHPTCTHFCVPEHAQGATSWSQTRGAPETSTSSSPTRQKRHARAESVFEDDV
mmetsp:Transcript_9364/g.39350  ORF Transcript_9364/g.39350 Transcript_9364/m.39350 type:complete len:210 (+) Transcript_9364:256-885(+)